MPLTARPGLQAADDLGGGASRCVERLEVDLDAAGVQRGVGAVDADEGGEAFNGRVLQDDVDQLLLALGHGGEADGLWRFGDAEDDAGVLHGEEALGHDDEEQHGDDDRADGDQSVRIGGAARPAQRFAVPGDDELEDVFGRAVEAALLGLGLVVEEA